MLTGKRRVALLIDTSRAYGRGLLRGVARHVRSCDHWVIDYTPLGLRESPEWLTAWRGEGILARIDNPMVARAIVNLGIPCIDMRGAFADLGLLPFGSDNRAVAKVAFDHLTDRGFRSFGFFGPPRGTHHFNDLRCDFFRQVVSEAGYDCDLFLQEPDETGTDGSTEHAPRIADWIDRLPKPAGILACHDVHGRMLLDACAQVNVHVPEEIAVIGVDNDACICDLCTPPLTSVDLNAERIGYEAAVVLDQLMDGTLSSQAETLFPPRGVVTRQSTDIIAVDDRHVAAAVGLIRTRACHGVDLSEIFDRIPLSQRALQRRFKDHLGRTIKAEIVRVRIERAKQLLIETDLPVKTVASRTGFHRSKYFVETFHRKAGMTPLEFRKRSKKWA